MNELDWMIDPDADDLETDIMPDTPLVMKVDAKVKSKAFLRREHLADFHRELPAPGEAIHLVSNGRFDYWHFIPVTLDLLGRPVDELTASTWVMNRENVVELIEMYDAGRLKKFSILTGEFFKRRCPAVVNLLIDEIQKRGQRYIASPNHTKIALFEAPPDYIVIEGSANWTSNPRIEQTVINNNRDLLEFHKRWMQKVLEGGIWRGRKEKPAKRP